MEEQRLGKGVHRVWSPEEDAFIIAHYSRMTLTEIAAALGVRFPNLQNRTYRLIREGRLDARKRTYNPGWTDEEVEYLCEKFGLVTDAWIARKLGRSVMAIRLKAKRLGLIKKQNMMTMREVARVFRVNDKVVRRWIYIGALQARKGAFYQGPNRVWQVTIEDVDDFIKNHPELYECRDIDIDKYPWFRNLAEQYAFDARTGRGRYRRPHRQFTDFEDRYIIDNYKRLTPEQIAERLGRTPRSIRGRVNKMRGKGIRVPRVGRGGRPYSGPNAWTQEQVAYLTDHWGQLPRCEIAFVVGHTPQACTAQAMRLKLTSGRGSNRYTRKAVGQGEAA